MGDVRKTSGAGRPQAVIYDLARARQRAAQQVPETDSAGITENARELNRARAAVENAPDARAARVQELRDQIADGTYQPDPRDVAREILRRGF